MKTKKSTSTKKQSKKRVSPIKKIENDCFTLWSRCVIARDKTCRYTNSDERLSAHHIRSRTHHATRFSLDNGIALSWKVHFLQKANPERFQDMVIEIIGQDKYEELKRRSQVAVKHTIPDLEEIKRRLEIELKHIQAGLNFYDLPF